MLYAAMLYVYNAMLCLVWESVSPFLRVHYLKVIPIFKDNLLQNEA